MPGALRTMATLAATVVATVALAGCGADPAGESPAPDAAAPSTTQDTPPPPPPPAPPDDRATVPEALAFQSPTVDGGTLDAATLAGQPVVFWFWAAWCTRCAAFAADLRDVQAEYEGRVHLVGVAGLGSGTDAMRGFVDQHDLDAFPHLADDDGGVWVRFEVTTQEYLVILDTAGEIIHEGPLSAADLRSQLAALVA